MKEKSYFSIAKLYETERERERERHGAPRSNALTSGSPAASPKSGPDHSRRSRNNIVNVIHPVGCLRVPPGVRVPQVGDDWSRPLARARITLLLYQSHRVLQKPKWPCWALRPSKEGVASECRFPHRWPSSRWRDLITATTQYPFTTLYGVTIQKTITLETCC
jgi:hypothetical protein